MKKMVLILVSFFIFRTRLIVLLSVQKRLQARNTAEEMVELNIVKKDYLIKICNKYLEYPKRWREVQL